jgi:YVTN family beta-propeller protein
MSSFWGSCVARGSHARPCFLLLRRTPGEWPLALRVVRFGHASTPLGEQVKYSARAADVPSMNMATATLTRPASTRRDRPANALSRGGCARVTLAAVCACAAFMTATPLAQAATPYTAYVSNLTAESLSPINTATNIAGSPIPAKSPPFLAITPDGTTAWVTNSTQGTVTPITLATGAAGTPISVGTGPYAIAITPDGSKAYVAIHGADAVTPVNLIARTAGSPIKVGKEPWAIAITPDGSRAYVTNYGSSSVTPINTATQTAGGEIKVAGGPQSIAVAPDGTTAWVADFTANAITPITLATNTAGPTVAVKEPNSLAITAGGTAAYVTDYSLNTVTPVNLATRTVGTAIKVGSLPFQVAITPDGGTAYVTNDSSNSVTPINTATQTAGGEIKAGAGPDGIAITPDEAPVASFTVSAAQAGSPSSFNASSSSVAHGAITSYAWSFGDGSTATTSTATTTHTYATAGNYTATLTETDSAGTSTTVAFTGQTVSRNGGPSARTTRSVSVANALKSSLPGGPRPTRVVISIKSATVNRHGVAVIPLRCPAGAAGGCHGKITITISVSTPRGKRARASRCARGCRPLGSTSYEARAGQKVRVRVHIASFGRRLLKQHSSVRVTLTATSVSGGQTATVTRAIALKHGA